MRFIKGTSELVFEDGPSFEPTSHVVVTVMPPVPPPGADDDGEAYVMAMQARYTQWLGTPFRPAE